MSKPDFIYAVIPSEYQSFFNIETNLNPTKEVIYSLEAFGEAVKRLFTLIMPQKAVSAVFGYRDLLINFKGVSLQYELPFEVQVANYTEELVHAFMNTNDENFTHQIVELICPDVYYCDNGFELK